MKDTSMTVYKKKRVLRIIKFFKSFFTKHQKEETQIQTLQLEIKNETNEMDDFDLLKKLIEGRIDIAEIDNESKKRLIAICNNRLEGIHKQIYDKKNEIRQMESMLAKINAM